MTVDEESASIIQAAWRGYRARKYILQTRIEYEKIVKEIEGSLFSVTPCNVTWPSKYLCYPKFLSCQKESVQNDISKWTCTTIAKSQDITRTNNCCCNVIKTPQSLEQDIGTQTSLSVNKEEEVESSTYSLSLSCVEKEEGEDNEEDIDFMKETEYFHNGENSPVVTVSDSHVENADVQLIKHKEDLQHENDTYRKRKNENTQGNFEGENDEIPLGKDEFPISQVEVKIENVDPEHNVEPVVPYLLTDSWNTEKSFGSITSVCDKEKVRKEQNDLVLELLWIQQAIESRKGYLRIKKEK